MRRIDLSKITGQRNMPSAPGKPATEAPVAPGQVRSSSYRRRSARIQCRPDGGNRGVKVFTVGFGTRRGNHRLRWLEHARPTDEDTLKKIASLTMGEYFHAGSGADLNRVYEALKSRLVFERKDRVTVRLRTPGASRVVGRGLSVVWSCRVTGTSGDKPFLGQPLAGIRNLFWWAWASGCHGGRWPLRRR